MTTTELQVFTEDDLVRGLEQLNELAGGDYGKDIASILDDPERDMGERLFRMGRLLGVSVKQPFAEPVNLSEGHSRTGSARGWGLLEASFSDPERQETWQHQVLSELADENNMDSPKQLAQMAQHETGFLYYLARSFRKYMCDDPDLKEKIREKLEEAERQGISAQILTPKGMIAAGGATIGSALVAAIPWLSAFAAPVVTGLVILLLTLGLDAFCDWSNELENQAQPDYNA